MYLEVVSKDNSVSCGTKIGVRNDHSSREILLREGQFSRKSVIVHHECPISAFRVVNVAVPREFYG